MQMVRSIRTSLHRAYATRRAKIVLGVIALTALALVASINPIGVIGGTPSADNPDGVDPPQTNPRPQEIVKIRVFAPSSLKIALHENYYAPSGRGFGSAFGPGLCSKDPTKSVPAGHSRQVPIVLTGSDGEYSGAIVADRFLPGRCEWGFFGISSDLKEDTPVLYGFGGPSPANPHGPEQVADIWCADNPIPTEPSKFICTSFLFFATAKDYRSRCSPRTLTLSLAGQRTPYSWTTPPRRSCCAITILRRKPKRRGRGRRKRRAKRNTNTERQVPGGNCDAIGLT